MMNTLVKIRSKINTLNTSNECEMSIESWLSNTDPYFILYDSLTVNYFGRIRKKTPRSTNPGHKILILQYLGTWSTENLYADS